MNAFLENMVAGHENVLVDFYADWCEPCKWIVPVLSDVEKHFGTTVKFEKVDIDLHADLARSLHILSVPSLILFVNGKEAWRRRGFDTAEEMIRELQKFV